jgi:uncharacterized RDD family membrane protein YckC
MIYEALLVFGVVFVAILVALLVNEKLSSHDAATLNPMLQAWLFIVIGVYFIFFWRRSGQTLAMKTWGIKLTAPGLARITLRQAVLRYLLAWMWFFPAIVLDYALGLKHWASIGAIGLGMVLWAATVLLDKDRQFLHDKLVGTRLVNLKVAKTKPVPPTKTQLSA